MGSWRIVWTVYPSTMLIAIAIGINTITRVLNCRDSQAMVLGPPSTRTCRAPSPRRARVVPATAWAQCPTPDIAPARSPWAHARPSADPRRQPSDALDEPRDERLRVAADRHVQRGRPAPGAAPVRDGLASRE